MKNIGEMMKQVQAMQSRMAEMQAKLEQSTVTGQSGGGMVKVTMTGEKKVTAVAIDRQVVNPDDVEMLQDLIVAALTEASARVDEQVKDKIGSLTGGMKLPGF